MRVFTFYLFSLDCRYSAVPGETDRGRPKRKHAVRSSHVGHRDHRENGQDYWDSFAGCDRKSEVLHKYFYFFNEHPELKLRRRIATSVRVRMSGPEEEQVIGALAPHGGVLIDTFLIF